MRRVRIAAMITAAALVCVSLAGCKNSYRNYEKIDIGQLEEQSLEAASKTPARAGESPAEDSGEQELKPEQTRPGADRNRYLGGARLTLLANQSDSQMLSCVIESRKGSVIVVDGGTEYDADHLAKTIRDKGGRVAVWLVTHPHSDHIGALTKLLSDDQYEDLQIDNIYYSIEPQEWYEEFDSEFQSGRAAMVAQFREAVEAKLPAKKRHEYSEAGTKLVVDEITITVLNKPYLIHGFNAINDSSVAYMLHINQKKVIFLGDLGPKAGEMFMADYADRLDWLDCDVVQMAHHGQYGVEEEVYQVLNPEICLWPTPGWLWDNMKNGVVDAGDWDTINVRGWMDQIGVKKNLCIKDGDQVLE